MPKFVVRVDWSMYGTYEVEAPTLEDAIDLVESAKQPYDGLPFDKSYIDGSFAVNKEATVAQAVLDGHVPEGYELEDED